MSSVNKRVAAEEKDKIQYGIHFFLIIGIIKYKASDEVQKNRNIDIWEVCRKKQKAPPHKSNRYNKRM
ncbi:hypothetical protein MGA3_04505 [Bacillus methanolicus MGA3]|nr:hypothetical protein MGA3_04505 [Bacillus methanolicus MGA3]